MRIPYSIQSMLLVPALCGAGCSVDFQHPDSKRRDAESVMMSYSVSSPFTRAEGSAFAETAVDHAFLLFFTGSDALVATARAEGGGSGSDCLKFDIPENLEENHDYTLVALANADEYVPAEFDSYQSFLASFEGNPLRVDDARLILFRETPLAVKSVSALPMKGRMKDDAAFRFSRKNSGIMVDGNLEFDRLVARIDVVNNVEEGFDLKEVGICNWRNACAPLSADNVSGQVCGVLSEGIESCEFMEIPASEPGAPQELRPAFYCFPSYSDESRQGDESTVAVLLKAVYGEDPAPTYYRVNIGKTGLPSKIESNTRYNLTIRSVKRSGKATPFEAYLSEEESPVETPELALVACDDAAGDSAHLASIESGSGSTAGRIVIDGFAPESFNSFIDVPLRLQVGKSLGENVAVEVSSDMVWPLEGAISVETLKERYFYSPESFTDGSVWSKAESANVSVSFPGSHSLSDGDIIYISVGAMAPDDPAITRTITLKAGEKSVVYDLVVRPRQVIIDDVIVEYDGKKYLVADRNYQDYESCPSRTCWNNGRKRQAYHYCSFSEMKIPFKTAGLAATDLANEAYHSEMLGYKTNYRNKATFKSKIGQWKNIVRCDDENCESPFYTSEKVEEWGYVFSGLLKEMGNKMHVSKMRMFLISEAVAKSSDSEIPICCYIPYFNKDSTTMSDNNADGKSGVYFLSDRLNNTFDTGNLCKVIRCNNTSVEILDVSSSGNPEGCVRPTLELTETEYDEYLKNYLGHEGGNLCLTSCRPDLRE